MWLKEYEAVFKKSQRYTIPAELVIADFTMAKPASVVPYIIVPASQSYLFNVSG